MGQTFFSSYTHDTGKVTEGVQQPYEIFIITRMDEKTLKPPEKHSHTTAIQLKTA